MTNTEHPYWKGKLTETALHKVVTCIEDSLCNLELTLSAFLVLRGESTNKAEL